jgi:hypothetical protein
LLNTTTSCSTHHQVETSSLKGIGKVCKGSREQKPGCMSLMRVAITTES